MLAGWFLVGQLLQVVGQDDGGHPPLSDGGADRPVDQVADLRGRRGLLDEGPGHVLEQALEVDLLLVVPSDGGAGLLAADGQHWHVVQARVVEAGDQVRGPGTGGRHADSQLAGELGVRRGHEGGHLFVPRLDELDLALGPVQGPQHAVDAVAGVAVDSAHPPGVEPLDQEIANGPGHAQTPSCPRQARLRGLQAEPARACGVPEAQLHGFQELTRS